MTLFLSPTLLRPKTGSYIGCVAWHWSRGTRPSSPMGHSSESYSNPTEFMMQMALRRITSSEEQTMTRANTDTAMVRIVYCCRSQSKIKAFDHGMMGCWIDPSWLTY